MGKQDFMLWLLQFLHFKDRGAVCCVLPPPC